MTKEFNTGGRRMSSQVTNQLCVSFITGSLRLERLLKKAKKDLKDLRIGEEYVLDLGEYLLGFQDTRFEKDIESLLEEGYKTTVRHYPQENKSELVIRREK
jgi:hypothetical protein